MIGIFQTYLLKQAGSGATGIDESLTTPAGRQTATIISVYKRDEKERRYEDGEKN